MNKSIYKDYVEISFCDFVYLKKKLITRTYPYHALTLPITHKFFENILSQNNDLLARINFNEIFLCINIFAPSRITN